MPEKGTAVLLDLTPEQESLQETTDKFLTKEASVADLRARRHDPDGFDRSYWRRGAELGWTSLLVAEEHGGGSVSGSGLVDLTLLAYQFGRRAAPGPLAAANLAAAALSGAALSGGGDQHAKVLEGILEGSTVATWALEEAPAFGADRIQLDVEPAGREVVISGRKRPVEAGGQADFLLVTGRTGPGLTQVLVPVDAPGVTVRPLESLDLTRRFAAVDFDAVRLPASAVVGAIGGAGPAVHRQIEQALVIHSAETVGAMVTGFALTVEWAFDRYSFGRPLASYQALKHRFADMKAWLEGAHAITDAAALAVDSRAPDAADLASAAKAFVGQYGIELLQDCVQIHGGIGVTFEHDLHIYLRRASLDRMLCGTPTDHRRALAARALGQEDHR